VTRERRHTILGLGLLPLAAAASAGSCQLRFDERLLLIDAAARDAAVTMPGDDGGRAEAMDAPPTDTRAACPEPIVGSATVTLLAPLACGGNLPACLAVVPPFLFVGVSDGVLAVRVVPAPSSERPAWPVIADAQALRNPGRVVASGRRLFALGPLTPAAAPTHASIPFLDVPPSATLATALTWRAAAINLPTLAPSTPMATPADALALWPARDQGLFVVANWDGGNARAALHPLAPSDTVAYPLLKLDGTDHVVSSSFSRLVVRTARTDQYRLVDAATTAGATLSPALDGRADLPLRTAFVSGPGGAVLFEAHLPGAAPQTVRAVRAGWLFGNEGEAMPDASRALDVETYGSPITTSVYLPTVGGHVAALDATHALVLSPSTATPTRTHVQIVTGPAAPRVLPNRGQVLDAEFRNTAAVAGDGIGYVVVRDPTAPTILRISAYSAGCP
jgi:hypothetical protein